MSAPKYIDEDVKKLAKKGLTSKQICETLKVASSSVTRSKKRLKLEIPSAKPIPNPEFIKRRNTIYKLKDKGLTSVVIAERLGISRQRVFQVLKERTYATL